MSRRCALTLSLSLSTSSRRHEVHAEPNGRSGGLGAQMLMQPVGAEVIEFPGRHPR